MVSKRSILRFTSGYGLSVVIGGVLSVAVIPVVIILAGAQVWATIAVSQAVAGFGVVIVAAGWGVTGPTDIASRAPEDRAQFYVDSLVTRSWLYVLAIIPAVLIAVLLTGHNPAIAGVTVAAGLLAGLSAGWYFVGEGSPIRFLTLETLPRNAGTVVGAIMLIITHDALWYVAFQALAALVATAVSSASILRRYRGWKTDSSFRRGMTRLKEHLPAISMSATSTVYVNLPIVVVQIFLPHATAVYALAERIMRLALYSTRPLVQVSQGYVPSPSRAEQVRRARRVVNLALVLSVAGGILYAALAPLAGTVLSGATLAIPFTVSLPLGAALAAMLISQVTGFACLTSFGLTRVLAGSTVVGAIVGLALLIPLALLFGLVGLVAALAASELAVLVVQLLKLRPVLLSRARGVNEDSGATPD